MLKIIKNFSSFFTSVNRICSSQQFGGISSNITIESLKRKQTSPKFTKTLSQSDIREEPLVKLDLSKQEILNDPAPLNEISDDTVVNCFK